MVDDIFQALHFSSTKLIVDERYNLGGLQVGGGINSDNCLSYIEEGASHVIVTSVSHISSLLLWVIQLLQITIGDCSLLAGQS